MVLIVIVIIIIENFVYGIGFERRYLKDGTTVPLVTYDDCLKRERKGLKFAATAAVASTIVK